MGFAHINQGKDSTIEPAYIAGLVDSSVKPTLENKEVAPSTSQQVVVADEGYDGLGAVTVEAVTAAIDSDIKAENIKKDVEILGIVGSLETTEPVIIEKQITQNGEYSAAADEADGYGTVNVQVEPNLGTKNITNNATYLAVNDGVDGYEKVIVEVEPNLENKSIAPSTEEQVVECGLSYDGLGTVTVGAVTSSIDENIVAGNIKKDVEILGVVGSYEDTNNAKFAATPTADFNPSNNLIIVNVPNGIITLKDYAFSNYKALESISIPSSVTDMGSNTFMGCTNLTTITINKPEGSITGAPWGAPNATVIWTG